MPSNTSSDLALLTQKLIAFRDERDWAPFHKPKDLALSLCLEAAELLELFQWKNEAQSQEFVARNPEALRDELADVLGWVLILAHEARVDLVQAVNEKIKKNALKYPVQASKGRSNKYTDL